MEIRVHRGSLTEVPCDALVVNLFEGVTVPGGATGAADQALGGALSRWIREAGFRGKAYETAVLPTYGRLPARCVVLVGLGPREAFTRQRATLVAAAAIRAAQRVQARRVATIVHGAGIGGMEPVAAARALVEGSLYGAYRFDRYRTAGEEERVPVEELIVVERDEKKAAAFQEGIRIGRILGEATNLARDLGNEPPNVLTPQELARRAQEMAQEAGLECQVLDSHQLERLGARALLAVGSGSTHPPVMIVLRYRGRPEASGWDLALAGKGITFDSGGLSLKTAKDMEDMKLDMSGAAAVLAATVALARLKPRLNVLAVAPAAENMPGGRAFRPGDILRTLSGKTIEVVNTDAEGRLILADAVAYACQQGAARVVDVATLTGAARIALGTQAAALLANDEALAAAVERAAETAGERVWRLPSWEEYREQYRSDVADMKNVGGREGGAIIGGLIIGEAAGRTPWAHLDIAPTAWGEAKPYQDRGATGTMTRTLAQLALDLAEALPGR